MAAENPLRCDFGVFFFVLYMKTPQLWHMFYYSFHILRSIKVKKKNIVFCLIQLNGFDKPLARSEWKDLTVRVSDKIGH